MSFESLSKILGNGNAVEVTSPSEIAAALSGKPVTENVSGLATKDVFLSVGEHRVIRPNIGGDMQRPTIVVECEIRSEGSKDARKRPIYLSSLIRKINLSEPFKGMLATDAAFKGCEDFTNEQWLDAFRAVGVFHVEGLNQIERPITPRTGNGAGVSRMATIRELVLAVGEPKTAKAAEPKKA